MTTQAPALPAPPIDTARWRFSPLGWSMLAFALVVAYVPFAGVLNGLFTVWSLQPEYSHGMLIPPISLFLIWRERNALTETPFQGSWAGVALVMVGVLTWYAAELSTIYVIGQYAFLIVLYGLVLSLVGARVFRRLWMPLLVLIFMIPLPAFFSNYLSLQLQLISSELGVAVIRLAGISVYLEGNVIDLGTYQLQVAEACSGLRYLFPLMTLAFILAYFFHAPMWKRLALFAASIPITVLMNSLRIGVIGVTVEHWGPAMAEGVLHQFEGWLVFMISMAALLMFAALLVRLGPSRSKLRDALALDYGSAMVKSAQYRPRAMPAAFLAATVLVTAAAVLSFMLPERVEIKQARAAFAEFPLQLGAWIGKSSPLESVYVDALKLDDYLLAGFNGADRVPVSVWVAYYDSQRKGQSAHSPKSCLPGGGWEFDSLGPYRLSTPQGSFTVNRAMIRNGSDRQLMYYWFQERGRVVTNEYLVKWLIFKDALLRNRTDGALVRLMAPLPAGSNEARADRQLSEFTALLMKDLPRFVPN